MRTDDPITIVDYKCGVVKAIGSDMAERASILRSADECKYASKISYSTLVISGLRGTKLERDDSTLRCVT